MDTINRIWCIATSKTTQPQSMGPPSNFVTKLGLTIAGQCNKIAALCLVHTADMDKT